MQENNLILELYVDIIKGYSNFSIAGKEVYIKHFSVFEDTFINKIQYKKYNEAIKKGLPSLEKRLEFIYKKKMWSVREEDDLKAEQFFLDNLRVNHNKAAIPSQRRQLAEEIATSQDKVDKAIATKESLIGLTAEKYAAQQSNNYYIYYSIFKERDFKENFFTLSEFEDLDSPTLNHIIGDFNSKIKEFGEINIKKVALSNYFQKPYSFCDTAYNFLGKPICYITYYQSSLLSLGSYYKSILTNPEYNIPDEVMTDPNKLEEWYSGNMNTQKLIDKYNDKEGNIGIFGATQQDLKEMGLNTTSANPMLNKLQEQGSLSMMEMMRMEGAI